MKRWLLSTVLMGASLSAYAGDGGVSISVDQPGLYGRIDIGNAPTPQVVYEKPVVILRPPPGVAVQEPLYLHVPPGHAKNWRKHCREYNACGQPVYFVQDRWFDEVYVPARREHRREHGEHHEDHRENGQGHGHGEDHSEDHDRDR